MSTDTFPPPTDAPLEEPPKETSPSGTAVSDPLAHHNPTHSTGEIRKDSVESRKASVNVQDNVARKESPAKELPKETKKGGSRRVSMFEDTMTLPKPGDSGGMNGNLKETLQDYFSNQPKDTPDATTTLKPLRRPKLVFENTYRLESTKPFSSSRVQTHIQQILDDMLSDFKYNSKTSANKAMEVAEKMRRSVLSLRFERYKICVLVTISPFNRQGFFSGFRCLWDANRDSYAVATLRNPSMFAIAVCYGIYFE